MVRSKKLANLVFLLSKHLLYPGSTVEYPRKMEMYFNNKESLHPDHYFNLYISLPLQNLACAKCAFVTLQSFIMSTAPCASLV